MGEKADSKVYVLIREAAKKVIFLMAVLPLSSEGGGVRP